MTGLALENTLTCGMDLTCTLKRSYVDTDDSLRYTAYGIIITDQNGDIVLEIDDISTDLSEVENFMLVLERGEVWLGHVKDVLEDYLQ